MIVNSSARELNQHFPEPSIIINVFESYFYKDYILRQSPLKWNYTELKFAKANFENSMLQFSTIDEEN